VSYDTITFELFRNLQDAGIWFKGLHREWLKENLEFVQKTSSSVMYRVLVFPYPYAISPYHRKALREFIVLNLHVHLWHGVVCGIKFLDPQKYAPDFIAQELSFSLFPRARSLLDFPGYYLSESVPVNTVEGSDFDRRIRRIQDLMLGDGSHLLWLFYDQEHYAPERLEGWHWKQLRRLFLELTRNDTCPECRERPATALDHIGPVASAKFPQILPNFQLLCKPCNSSKGSYVLPRPLERRYYRLPDHLDTYEMKTILESVPPWLGKVRRPERNRLELFRAIGFT
jgi:hypothetical protein